MATESDDSTGSGSLRSLLLEAAHRILAEPDTALELREVARRAGKSRTAPYLVFGKESEGGGLLGLKIAVAAEGARDMADRMEDAAETGGPPLEAFHAVAMAFLEFVEGHRRLFRLMYGPDIAALPVLGEEGFSEHPEFQALLEHRTRAGHVVSGLIAEGQAEGRLPLDPRRPEEEEGKDAEPHEPLDLPSARLLQIAWATMIGVALLRDDELLRSIGWPISLEQGAGLVVESVFGQDPKRDVEAALSFLESPGVGDATRTRASAEEAFDFHDDDHLRELTQRRVEYPADLFDAPSAPATFAERASHAPMPAPESPPDEAVPPATARAARGLPLFEGEAPRAPRQLEFTLSEALDRHSGLQRATRSRTTMSRARILWIDDHPDWIVKGVETLERLGATVSVAPTTEAAKRTLRGNPRPEGPPFDVIVSDIARGSRPDAGIRALPELRALAPETPVIFFVGDYRPELGVPKGAAGITNRTNELLHLVLDALEGR